MNEKIELANPYNGEHIKLFEEFDKNNNITNGISDDMKNISIKYTEEEFKLYEKKTPEIRKIIFLKKDNQIVSYCQLLGEKDLKLCQITLGKNPSKKIAEKMLSIAEDYAFLRLDMEDIVFISEDSIITQDYLQNHEFDSLGSDTGKDIYMKSKNQLKSAYIKCN